MIDVVAALLLTLGLAALWPLAALVAIAERHIARPCRRWHHPGGATTFAQGATVELHRPTIRHDQVRHGGPGSQHRHSWFFEDAVDRHTVLPSGVRLDCNQLADRCPSLQPHAYNPSWAFPNGNCHTMYMVLMREAPECVDLPSVAEATAAWEATCDLPAALAAGATVPDQQPAMPGSRNSTVCIGGAMPTLDGLVLRRLRVPVEDAAVHLDFPVLLGRTLPEPFRSGVRDAHAGAGAPLGCVGPRAKGIALIVHGLCGGSFEAYIQWQAAAAALQGLTPVLFNARGCNAPLEGDRLMVPSASQDIGAALAVLRAMVGSRVPIVLVGFSLGGAAVKKYLCDEDPGVGPSSVPGVVAGLLEARLADGTPVRQPKSTPGARADTPLRGVVRPGVIGAQAAVSVASSGCPHSVAEKLRTDCVAQLYSRVMAIWYRAYALAHARQLRHEAPGSVFHTAPERVHRIRDARSVMAVDEQTIAAWGYSSYADYLADATVRHRIADPTRLGVQLPLLMIAAADDPIMAADGINYTALSTNPNVALALTAHGGHIGWVEGGFPTPQPSWAERAAAEFAARACEEWNAQLGREIGTAAPGPEAVGAAKEGGAALGEGGAAEVVEQALPRSRRWRRRSVTARA